MFSQVYVIYSVYDGCIPMGQAEGWCVSQNVMGQAGGMYPECNGADKGVVCIPACNETGRGWCIFQNAMGQAVGVV